MTKPMMGIDIDGTLTEYDSFLPYLNQLLNTKVTPEQIVQYDLHEIFGMEYNAFSALFDEHSIPIYKGSIPRPCAQEQLKWIDKEFDIVYITARYAEFEDLTREWLREHGFPERRMVFTGSHDKIQAMKRYRVQVMVEDRLESAMQMHEELGIPVFLLDTPYNQSKLPEGIYRVKNWHEIQFHLNHKGIGFRSNK